MTCRSCNRGSVLLLVLFVLVVLSLAAVSLSYRMSLGLRSTRDRAVVVRMDALNRSAVAVAMSRLAVDGNDFDHPGEAWGNPLAISDADALPGWAPAEEVGPLASGALTGADPVARTSLWVRDEGSRMHLLFASGQALEELGFTPEEVDAVFDWMDADADPSPQGAETGHYRALPGPYTAKDAPVEVLEELQLVRGLGGGSVWSHSPTAAGEEVTARPLSLLTVLGDGRVNVNTAEEAVLAALPLREEVVDQILAFRRYDALTRDPVEDHAFASLEDLAALQGIDNDDLVALGQLCRFTSSFFRIQAMTEDPQSGIRRWLRVLVQRGDGGEISVLQWREGA